MKKLAILLIPALVFILLNSCNESSLKNENPESEKEAMIQSEKSSTKIEYEIIKENRNPQIQKVNIDIRLSKEVDENELKEIALKLKAERPGFKMLWIFYYLPGHELGNGAWAYTHFSPNLEVKILGATEAASKELENRKVSEKILGAWKDNDPTTPNRIFLIEENGKLYMKTLYAKTSLFDASELVVEVKEQSEGGITRYDFENNHGEYYILEKNGNMGMYGNNGRFKEAIKE